MNRNDGRAARLLRALNQLLSATRALAAQQQAAPKSKLVPDNRRDAGNAPTPGLEGATSATDGLPFTAEQFAALVKSRDPSAMKRLAAGLATRPMVK